MMEDRLIDRLIVIVDLGWEWRVPSEVTFTNVFQGGWICPSTHCYSILIGQLIGSE